MKVYTEGDRSAGICESCRARVATRMEYRDYTPPGWTVTVPDVLLGVCERCGGVVSVPHQSTHKINRYREATPRLMKPLAVRVPRQLDEALGLVGSTLGGPSQLVLPAVIRFYLAQVAASDRVAALVKARCDDFQGTGKSDTRIIVRVAPGQLDGIVPAMRRVGIRNKAELLRGVVGLAARDCGIVSSRSTDPARGEVADEWAKQRRAILEGMASAL